jgi:membrane glycosyltransferase
MISRLHLLTGIGSYLTAPLWLLFILTGILIAVQARFVQPDYFPEGKSLFPQWPVVDPVRAMWMFVGTMALLLLPKLFGCFAVLVHRPERRGCGGMLRLLAGVVFESLIAGLMAPVVMLTQTIDVVAILRGRDSGWNVQRRDGGGIPVRETVRLYRRHTILGVALGVLAWLVSPYLAAWMLPVVLGLALAIPLAVWTGRASRHAALLRTPEQTAPPAIVARASALQLEWQALPMPDVEGLLNDAQLLRTHQAMLPPPRRPRIDPIDVTLLVARTKLDEAEALQPALEALTAAELAIALGDAVALRRLTALSSHDPLVSAAA